MQSKRVGNGTLSMQQFEDLRADIHSELAELSATVDELEETVESVERTLVANKLGGDTAEEVRSDGQADQVVSVTAGGAMSPASAD